MTFELDPKTEAREAISIFVLKFIRKTSLASLTDGHADLDGD